MKIDGSYSFNAPKERVWNILTSQDALQKCIPGCERLIETEPGKYDAVLKIGIAAVKGTYNGKVEMADVIPLQSFKLKAEGGGTPGYVKGEADIKLNEQDGKTTVIYNGDSQVGGLIASVGQRLLGGIAKMLVGQFFKKMDELIK